MTDLQIKLEGFYKLNKKTASLIFREKRMLNVVWKKEKNCIYIHIYIYQVVTFVYLKSSYKNLLIKK